MFIQFTQRTHARHQFATIKGFTLVELLITIAIIGILASIALPAYQDSVTKSRRADAQGALLGFANAMERHFTTNDASYLGAAGTQLAPADTGSPWIFSTTSPVDGGTAAYNLTITVAGVATYTLRATPVGPQAGDGIIEITNTGARRWDEDNSGVFNAAEENWEIN